MLAEGKWKRTGVSPYRSTEMAGCMGTDVPGLPSPPPEPDSAEEEYVQTGVPDLPFPTPEPRLVTIHYTPELAEGQTKHLHVTAGRNRHSL